MVNIHGPRLFGMAVVDWIMTIIGAIIIMKWKKKSGVKAFGGVMIGLVLIAIVAHVVTGTPTRLNQWLGLSGPPAVDSV